MIFIDYKGIKISTNDIEQAKEIIDKLSNSEKSILPPNTPNYTGPVWIDPKFYNPNNSDGVWSDNTDKPILKENINICDTSNNKQNFKVMNDNKTYNKYEGKKTIC